LKILAPYGKAVHLPSLLDNRQLTEIAMVLDRSGSMENMAKEAIGGSTASLNPTRKNPAKPN
jgi:hypothetical protein